MLNQSIETLGCEYFRCLDEIAEELYHWVIHDHLSNVKGSICFLSGIFQIELSRSCQLNANISTLATIVNPNLGGPLNHLYYLKSEFS